MGSYSHKGTQWITSTCQQVVARTILGYMNVSYRMLQPCPVDLKHDCALGISPATSYSGVKTDLEHVRREMLLEREVHTPVLPPELKTAVCAWTVIQVACGCRTAE